MNDRDPHLPWDDDFTAVDDVHGEDDWALVDPTASDGECEDRVLTLLFTATNPSGTVSVSSLISGQPVEIELDRSATGMTERRLAEEIATVAFRSTQQALAAQHVLIDRYLGRLGHDRASTRSFLERDLGLPSPQTVRKDEARLFESYLGEDRDPFQ